MNFSKKIDAYVSKNKQNVAEQLEGCRSPQPINIATKLNVLILGIDSVSLNHFRRVFPLTYKYLNEKLEKNIIFERFNKIGENTYPNLIPLLTGLIAHENVELNLGNELNNYNDIKYHDNLPLIWRDYEKLGYLTMFNEEKPKIGVFRQTKKGFQLPPTAFYTTPYYLKYEQIQRDRTCLCFNNEPVYMRSLNLLQQFLDKIGRQPFFSFNFFKYYTHDYFVVPAHFDQKLKESIEYFEAKSYLENTLFIVMSDHGSRTSAYSFESDFGKQERSLPFFSMRLPKSLWSSDYYSNALSNRDKLFTVLDVHKMLKQFNYLNKPGGGGGGGMSDECRQNFQTSTHLKRASRGVSLFERLPERSCIEAMVPMIFCSNLTKIAYTDTDFSDETNRTVLQAGQHLLEHIVNVTAKFRAKCEMYKLDKVVSVKKAFENQFVFYEIQILVQPGEALFEGYLKRQTGKSALHIYSRVLRLSVYGRQSRCVSDNIRLLGFCYCKK